MAANQAASKSSSLPSSTTRRDKISLNKLFAITLRFPSLSAARQLTAKHAFFPLPMSPLHSIRHKADTYKKANVLVTHKCGCKDETVK